jgi:dTMP kinase
VADGLRFVLATPFLKWSFATFCLAPLAGGAMFVVVPLYANRVLREGPLTGPLRSGAFRFSVLEVSLGVGALAGSFVAVRLARRWPRGRVFGLGMLGMGCVDLLFATIKNLYVAVPVMAVHGLFNSLFLVSGATLLQQLAPSEMRGRVVAARSSVIYGALALGSAVGGVLLGRVSYSAMWLALGSIIALSSLLIWLRPDVRNQR